MEMKHEGNEYVKQTETELVRRLQQLEKELKEKQARLSALKRERTNWEGQILAFQNSVWGKTAKRIKNRRTKSAAKEKALEKVKNLSHSLNELGYVERALHDLDKLAQQVHTHEGQASIMELASWYTKTKTTHGAKQALKYLKMAVPSNPEDRQKLAILQDQCFHILKDQKSGRNLLDDCLQEPAPDPVLNGGKYSRFRHVDIVYIADFSNDSLAREITKQIEIHKQLRLTTGLVHKRAYGEQRNSRISEHIRKILDGESLQMITFGEKIACKLLVIRQAHLFSEKQEGLPYFEAKTIKTIIDAPEKKMNEFRSCHRNMLEFAGRSGVWHPMNAGIRQTIMKSFPKQLPAIKLSRENWTDILEDYANHLHQWLPEENPNTRGDIGDKKGS